MTAKRIPERMCMGCQEKHPKRDMIRIVRSPEGVYSVDATGKKPGRGTYICRTRECLEAARKNRGLERSFKSAIDRGVYDELEQQILSVGKE